MIGIRWLRLLLMGALVVPCCMAAVGYAAERGSAADPRLRTRSTAAEVDTLLFDSAGVRIKALASETGYTISLDFETADGAWKAGPRFPFPSFPRVSLAVGSTGKLVLLGMAARDFIGGVAVAIAADSAAVVYNRFAPEGGVCRIPTVTVLDGDVVLIENQAALFTPEACLDPFQECVDQFPSTWPALYRLDRSGLTAASEQYPTFYQEKATQYLSWADSIAGGALLRGQNMTTPETILEACGAGVVSGLRKLAARAEAIGNDDESGSRGYGG